MKHYVVQNQHSNVPATTGETARRVQNIEVILRHGADKASAEMIAEYYRALNTLVEGHTYLVNLRVIADEPVGEPLYWVGRTAIFWGDFESNWRLTGAERSWVSQVLSLAPRTLLVGGAVMLMAQTGRADQHCAAIHPNFEAAALECGLKNCGTGIHYSADGRTHSANSRLSAVRLMTEFVSFDHGEHLADTLRRYIGLAEPVRKHESQVANRLIRKANGDQLVALTVDKMLENIEEPLKISNLSALLGTSVRQLQRRFLCKTGVKLLATYKELRLERANSLLRYTDMPQIEVAAATGFSSLAAMSRAFFKHYNKRPESVRNQRFLGKMSS